MAKISIELEDYEVDVLNQYHLEKETYHRNRGEYQDAELHHQRQLYLYQYVPNPPNLGEFIKTTQYPYINILVKYEKTYAQSLLKAALLYLCEENVIDDRIYNARMADIVHIGALCESSATDILKVAVTHDWNASNYNEYSLT